MTIDKIVVLVLNGDGTADGDGEVDSLTDVINYSVTVTNTGNVTLEGIVVTDSLGGSLGTIATLAPGATSSAFTYSYSPTQADLDTDGSGDGDIDSVATATDDEAGTVTDNEDVPIGQEAFGCVQTPGYWKNHTEFWDGNLTNSGKHEGQGSHPDYDLLRIDSDDDGDIDENDSGLTTYNGIDPDDGSETFGRVEL